MSDTDQVLTIDVVSDVVCPWCYLGENASTKRLGGIGASRGALAALSARSDKSCRRARPTEYIEKKFGKSGGWSRRTTT